MYDYVSNDPVNADDASGKCPWCVLGFVVGAGVTAAVEAHNGTLNTPGGIGRVLIAGVAGALSGGASAVIAEGAAEATLMGLAVRAGANTVVGGAVGAGQTAANAATEGRVASVGEVAGGAARTAAFSGLGSAAGDAVGTGVNAMVSNTSAGVARSNAEMAEAMVQGSQGPGGAAISGLHPAPSFSRLGAAAAGGVSAAISGSEPAATAAVSHILHVDITQGCPPNSPCNGGH